MKSLLNSFLFNFKKNINNNYILCSYNDNSIFNFNYNIYLKGPCRNIIDYININNNTMFRLQNKDNYVKWSLLNINTSKNNLNINDNYDFSFYKEYDIQNILQKENC